VEVRDIFNIVLKDYPEFAHHLGDSASIVENPDFEKAIVKISSGLPLSDEQRQAASRLLSSENLTPALDSTRTRGDESRDTSDDDCSDTDDPSDHASKVMRCLKKQRMENDSCDKYVNLNVLPGTSVNCERLFSLAKHILTDTRKKTAPKLFEALLFLKVNRSLWDVYDVGKAMGRIAMVGTAGGGMADDDDEEDDYTKLVNLND
jgi:hypothetical protein